MTPVFVDVTGRRSRLVARTCWLLGGLGAVYVALVVVSLLLPPSLSRLSVPGVGPVLPGPGAAPLGQAEGEDEGPDVLLVRSPSPTPPRTPRPTAVRPSPTATARTGGGDTTGSTPVATPARTPTPAPTSAAPAPAPTPAATTDPPRASAAPTQPPGQSEPPGQASRSPRPRPTPSRGPQ